MKNLLLFKLQALWQQLQFPAEHLSHLVTLDDILCIISLPKSIYTKKSDGKGDRLWEANSFDYSFLISIVIICLFVWTYLHGKYPEAVLFLQIYCRSYLNADSLVLSGCVGDFMSYIFLRFVFLIAQLLILSTSAFASKNSSFHWFQCCFDWWGADIIPVAFDQMFIFLFHSDPLHLTYKALKTFFTHALSTPLSLPVSFLLASPTFLPPLFFFFPPKRAYFLLLRKAELLQPKLHPWMKATISFSQSRESQMFF